jgi:Zn-dependent protease with chaperone function
MKPPTNRHLAATLACIATAAAWLSWWAWLQRPPIEIQTLQSVLKRLSHGNNMGDQPINFMIASGSYTAQLAQARGLCKQDQCDMFSQLNPYKHYGNGWDELIRQGYAVGDIQGWTASSGTVVLTRAGFRAYGSHTGYLACTIAHEIAHYRRNHIFRQSYHDNHNLSELASEKREKENMKMSRKLELEADRDAAIMLARAGYKGRVCLDGLEFFFRSAGDGSRTEDQSTHPGYEDRIAAMRATYEELEYQPAKPERSSSIRFSYNPDDHLLTVTPS